MYPIILVSTNTQLVPTFMDELIRRKYGRWICPSLHFSTEGKTFSSYLIEISLLKKRIIINIFYFISNSNSIYRFIICHTNSLSVICPNFIQMYLLCFPIVVMIAHYKIKFTAMWRRRIIILLILCILR